MKFQAHSFYKSLEMARTKIKYENQQTAIFKKIRNAEYWFLCTALLLNEIYHPMKFQVHSFYSGREMARTKFKYENLQMAITQELRSAEYRSLCTALWVIERSIHTKFEVNPTYSD
jgi:hypothetical protein